MPCRIKGLTPLGRAWLDELNLLHHVQDSATAAERDNLIARANAAAARIDAEFADQAKAGQMQGAAAAFRALKAEREESGRPPPVWRRFVAERKDAAIRAMAREEARRNRWTRPIYGQNIPKINLKLTTKTGDNCATRKNVLTSRAHS